MKTTVKSKHVLWFECSADELTRFKSNQIKSNQINFISGNVAHKSYKLIKETVKKIDRETDIKTYKHTTH